MTEFVDFGGADRGFNEISELVIHRYLFAAIIKRAVSLDAGLQWRYYFARGLYLIGKASESHELGAEHEQ